MAMNRTILDWQHGRRIQGLPTLSTLVGPSALGVHEWGRWNASVPRSMLSGFNLTDIARAWLEKIADRLADWAWDLFRGPLTSIGIEVCTAQVMTRYDLDQLWIQSPDRKSDRALLTYRVLASTVGRIPLSFETLELELGVVSVLAGLCGVVPTDEWPAILLIARGDAADFQDATRGLERIAVRVPLLPIAVSVSAAVWKATASDSSREMALAKEGLVELSGVTALELTEKLLAAGVAEPLPHVAIARLAAEGLDPESAGTYVAAVVESRRTPSVLTEAEGLHRSAAELFLFDLLEGMPETRGLFEPNRHLEFRHGTRSAEADMVASALKLVIEVDGSYYHLNPEQYRRDRRKDHSYQRHGYWVLRFLAEDVVEASESILATILDAVALRRGPTIPRVSPCPIN